MKNHIAFVGGLALLVLIGIAAVAGMRTEYVFFALYTVLQYVVLATAWNILGGYAGYINFGVPGFFALGVYTTVVATKAIAAPFWLSFLLAGLVAGAAGAGLAYLTVRLKGVFFAIATLALSIVLHTAVMNWDFVGGARGVALPFPESLMWFGSANRSLFIVMLGLAIVAMCVARGIERSRIGRGLTAIRDDELAAECSGVPTFRLKLLAATASGALMGFAGAPYALFATYVDPNSAFALSLGINSLAMAMIGGTASWLGPVVGAALIASIQVVATVTISSEINLLLVGVLLIVFITAAPTGLIGLYQRLRHRSAR